MARAPAPRGSAHVEPRSDRLTATRGRREAAPILSLLTSAFLDGRALASAWRGSTAGRCPARKAARGPSGGGATRRGGQRWGGRESTDGAVRPRGERDGLMGEDKDESTATLEMMSQAARSYARGSCE